MSPLQRGKHERENHKSYFAVQQVHSVRLVHRIQRTSAIYRLGRKHMGTYAVHRGGVCTASPLL